MNFDPYRQWLQIPPGRRPPDHYQLLGVGEGETDTQRIEQCGTERYEHVRKYTLGPQRAVANRLLAEISQAINCLCDSEKRQEYDGQRAPQHHVGEHRNAESPVPEDVSSPSRHNAFSWQIVGRAALAVLRGIDRVLRRIAGPHNAIIHNFLRVAVVLGIVAVVPGVLLTKGPEPSHGEAVRAPVEGDVSTSPVVDELEDEELTVLEPFLEDDYEIAFPSEEPRQPDLESLLQEAESLDVPLEERLRPPGLPVPPPWPAPPRQAPPVDLLAPADHFPRLLAGRSAQLRHELVAEGGGSFGSERAVAAALHWLAAHQLPDGGWSFNHTLCPACGGLCRNPGDRAAARNAATALALLPLLAAGHTHDDEGDYRDVVRRGLYFLGSRMKLNPMQGGSFWEQDGRMYSHGLATIAFCEAYAMTGDRDLHPVAQASLNFISYAQDPVGGGWCYRPRQRGDTFVTSWQVAAIATAWMGRLRVLNATAPRASDYLDAVQMNNGATYGHAGRGQGHASTAMGLLCRMYLGWQQDNPSLQRGVEQIVEWGPSSGDLCYNYFATQVLWHYGGEPWQQWNSIMRDQLVNSQARQGHERGSWFFESGGVNSSERGGRLYCTAMATLTLEVYYRHLPIYRARDMVEEEFPE